MKKLHSLAFYALVTPAITLSSGAVLAEQATGQDEAGQKQSTQQDQDKMKSTAEGMQTGEKTEDQRGMQQQQAFMDSVPPQGMRASDLMDSEVKTTGDEDVGSVSELIIDKDGKVVAAVVGVSGFLGIGEKDVAISWDSIKMSGQADEQDLRIDMTRDELEAAPKFEKPDQQQE